MAQLNEEQKLETIEEASERETEVQNWGKYDDSSEQYAIKQAFINGAKWQVKRMYSEEDMAESFMACWKANVSDGIECKLSFKEWFKQYKK
jgi:small-conductance mechanosensitive channel